MSVKLKRKREGKSARPAASTYDLPIDRREPSTDLWQYAFLLTGWKKIGKTSLAIQGSDELVIQFDKPQIAYAIREICPKSWEEFDRALKELERRARIGDFPYNRIVVDGVGEWYGLCHEHTCRHFGIEHPQDVAYGKAWHKIRDDFTAAVNRMMRLQATAGCGLWFIAHAEWKETKNSEGIKLERMVPNLPSKCEEIINGKVDGWFVYDWRGRERVLVTLGDETMGAGHRIDGRFMTTDGRRVREICMGSSPADALEAFEKAFNNEQDYADFREWRDRQRGAEKKPARRLLKRAA